MDALIVVDMQNDFCPGGNLAVPEGDTILPVINKLSQGFEHTILTQDWHPPGHLSFASSHQGKKSYEMVKLDYGDQILWPDHCLQDTAGAQFHSRLNVPRAELILRKGFRKEIDSYSVFFENDHQTPTGLAGFLRDRDIKTLYFVGLATDFCVHWSVVDGRKQGFEIYVIEDATKGIDTNGSMADAMNKMRDAGARFIHSKEVL